MKKFKTKGIRQMKVYSRIFWHIQTHLGISRYRHLQNLCNPGIVRTLIYAEPKAFSEP